KGGMRRLKLFGWVEVKLYHPGPPRHDDEWCWAAVVDRHVLLGAHDALAESLFGPRTGGLFPPLAPQRGLPTPASSTVKREFAAEREALSPSWVSWAELKAVKWAEETAPAEFNLNKYRRAPDGQFLAEPEADFPDELALPPDEELEAGQEWQVG